MPALSPSSTDSGVSPPPSARVERSQPRMVASSRVKPFLRVMYSSPRSRKVTSPKRTYGYGSPTLELTVNGIHLGPSAADAASGASFVTQRDQTTGTPQQSTLSISVSSAATGASCSLDFVRYGDDVAPFHTGGYQVSS